MKSTVKAQIFLGYFLITLFSPFFLFSLSPNVNFSFIKIEKFVFLPLLYKKNELILLSKETIKFPFPNPD